MEPTLDRLTAFTKGSILFALLCLFASQSFGQFRIPHNEDLDSEHFHNRVGFFTGTSLVPTHIQHHISEDYAYVPTYGLEIGRSITDWFGVGIHNELELQHFVILDEDDNTAINRTNVYILTGIVYFIPLSHLGVYLGYGQEFTGMQRYEVYKIGIEYAFHISGGWDIAPEICYDRVGNLFNTFTFGITIGKNFNFKKNEP